MVYHFHLYERIYGVNFELFIGDGNGQKLLNKVIKYFSLNDESIKELKELIVDHPVRGLFNEIRDDEEISISSNIYIPNYSIVELESTIVHECVHLVSNIFRKIGIKHCNETDEPYAYLMGYFSYFIFEKINMIKEKENELNNKRKPRRVPKSKGKRI